MACRASVWNACRRESPACVILERDIRNVRDDGAWFCQNVVWARQFKPRLEQLVGWNAAAAPEWMRTHRVFEAATDHLLGLLPPCRRCACL